MKRGYIKTMSPKELGSEKGLADVIGNLNLKQIYCNSSKKIELIIGKEYELYKKMNWEIIKIIGSSNENDIAYAHKSGRLHIGNNVKKYHMQEITIINYTLTKIPKTLYYFPKLKYLALDFNYINEISGIDKLKNLEYFSMYDNELNELPENIGELKHLKELDLGHNKLKELPNCIGGLESLEELKLNSNSLEFLPESIGKLKNLKYLDVGNNQLKSLP